MHQYVEEWNEMEIFRILWALCSSALIQKTEKKELLGVKRCAFSVEAQLQAPRGDPMFVERFVKKATAASSSVFSWDKVADGNVARPASKPCSVSDRSTKVFNFLFVLWKTDSKNVLIHSDYWFLSTRTFSANVNWAKYLVRNSWLQILIITTYNISNKLLNF